MRLLDLYCCAGGAAVGYHRAGLEVVGVDIAPQPRYPFEFHQADALEFLAEHGGEFDAVHASPPCQAYSVTRFTHSKEHPMLIDETRTALEIIGIPYVIENVEGALLYMRSPMLLCGSMFGLSAVDDDGQRLALRRHRLFESSIFLMSAGGCAHDRTQVGGVYSGGPSNRRKSWNRGGYTPAKHVQEDLMGIGWMTRHELTQAIPPAYTEFIGGQLMDAVRARKVVTG